MSNKIEVLLVDVGNSSVKTTEVVDGTMKKSQLWKTELPTILSNYKEVPVVVSSVRKIDESSLDQSQLLILSHKTKLPITLDYETPETLGADRIAAAVGVLELFPGQDNLIIDMGTCMTIDLVDKSGVFRGGIIAPGLKMRMKSMAHFTDQLPDISSEWESIHSLDMGKSTKQCLYSGSYWGMVHEVKGVLKTLETDFTSLNTILTGGDAHFFESNLKAHIFAGSKIVQEGLYRIWKHQ